MIKFIKENSKAPNVDFFGLVFIGEDFGRNVLLGSTKSFSSLAESKSGRKSKIAQFGIHLIIEENVLWFYVSMENSLWMEKCNGFDDLWEDFLEIFFW